ncbi:hypothetical protein GGI07_003978 [Coemansia sp. Benny D115]|nr:hypothetical protein GGI07_003978 [Coemansia sp. Benny D115]
MNHTTNGAASAQSASTHQSIGVIGMRYAGGLVGGQIGAPGPPGIVPSATALHAGNQGPGPLQQGTALVAAAAAAAAPWAMGSPVMQPATAQPTSAQHQQHQGNAALLAAQLTAIPHPPHTAPANSLQTNHDSYSLIMQLQQQQQQQQSGRQSVVLQMAPPGLPSEPSTASGTPALRSAALPSSQALQGTAKSDAPAANGQGALGRGVSENKQQRVHSASTDAALKHGSPEGVAASENSPALSVATTATGGRKSKTPPRRTAPTRKKARRSRAKKEPAQAAPTPLVQGSSSATDKEKETKTKTPPAPPARKPTPAPPLAARAPPIAKHARSKSIVPVAEAKRNSPDAPAAAAVPVTAHAPPQTAALPHASAAMHQPMDVLGAGVQRLLAFHSTLGSDASTYGLEAWEEAIAQHFVHSGSLLLDFAQQTYDVPVSTAARFYHRLFGDGGARSIHVALGPATIHMFGAGSSIVSFHGALLTTTFANGRRILENGSLRVIFASDFRIRLWAFSAEDATVCLPRKRAALQDDALTKLSDATIARNLEWPMPAIVPKRRKSAYSRLPPEECALPPVALRHAEMASTMYVLGDLIELQVNSAGASMDRVLELWAESAGCKSASTLQKPSTTKSGASTVKRSRKRSVAAPSSATAAAAKKTEAVTPA